MPKTSYTDNTLATNPPGGKRHQVNPEDGDKLPTERYVENRASRGRPSAGKVAAGSRGVAAKPRKAPAKKRRR